MPASFLARHRTICEVLTEIKTIASQTDEPADGRIIELCDEALTYARAMSDKLTEYKSERDSIERMTNALQNLLQWADEYQNHGKAPTYDAPHDAEQALGAYRRLRASNSKDKD